MNDEQRLPRSHELMSRDDSALLVVDMQEKLLPLIPNHERVIWNIRRLIDGARILNVPVTATEQYPRGLGPTTDALKDRLDKIPDKMTFSCGGCPEIFRQWRDQSIYKILVTGIEAHVCVVQTVLGLVKRGCDVHLCWECVSSRGAEYRSWAIDRMRQAGAAITNHESVGFEWARDKDHPNFRGLNRLLRAGQIVDAEGG